MKVSNLLGVRYKERPADCVVDSHALMVRGGYMKAVGNGIYSEQPILRKITKKIEAIMREEMDAIDGQEVLFPVVMTSDIWEESGRYYSIGNEMVRFSDRSGSKMLLGMTHEEAAVHMAKEYGSTYANYPFMIYQIQRKFRDEARPRAGMIRVREFTMKDAYSFHTSMEDLEQYYNRCFEAYNNIFRRVGIPEVVSVASDSGMMGGSISHEYMLLTAAGEDTIVICSECDYRSNMEAADAVIVNKEGAQAELQCIETPDCKTIEAVCDFLKSNVDESCKAVVYQKNKDDDFVVAFLRGDLEVNETKLRNIVGAEIHAGEITEDSPIVAGYIGPYGINGVQAKFSAKDSAEEAEKFEKANAGKCVFYIDKSLKGIANLCAGANKEGYHYTGLNLERDLGEVTYFDFAKAVEGGICPCCGKPSISLKRGIEVGNIFQLGTKYTKSMNMQYTDAEGNLQTPVMGCYGIGVGRLAASICEERRDDYGPIWPISIAPYEVEICALRAEEPRIKTFADGLYESLKALKVDVLYDDRKVRPGAMFADADLIGAPIRVVVSPKNDDEGMVELSTRDKSIQKKVAKDNILNEIMAIREDMFAALM